MKHVERIILAPAGRSGGFTLVEILVVLAVIGLLAALLFPVFARVRENGRATQCAAHLRQVDLALAQYEEDNDGYYPEAGAEVSWDAIDPQTGRGPWMQQIYPYTGNAQLYACPSDIVSKYSYFLSARVAYLEKGTFAAVNERRIQFPAAFVLAGDTVGFHADDADKDDYTQNCVGGEANGTPSELWQRHNGGQNIAFADGHVKRFSAFNPDLMTFAYTSMRGWP